MQSADKLTVSGMATTASFEHQAIARTRHTTLRMSSIAGTQRPQQYYYLHIPKAGGYGMQAALSSNGAWVYNFGLGPPTTRVEQYYAKHPKRRVFMTEGNGFNTHPLRPALTMLREPGSHVLSQYFHCTESDDHKAHRRFMANTTLDDWLRYWVKAKSSKAPKRSHLDHKFKCYNPMNLQCHIAGWDGSKNDLRNKFEIVGVLERFTKSNCMMLVHILHKVPEICNCTGHRRIATNTIRPSHGVSHHGSSFNLTDIQMQLLTELTYEDTRMYSLGLELMDESLALMEDQYQVRLCG